MSKQTPRSGSLGHAKRPCFRAALQPSGALEILIYESIGYDWWTDGGVTAKSVRAKIDSAGTFEELILRINSPGGDAFEGIAIYNVVRGFGKPVTVYVDGIAASSASIIAMAGDKIIMGPNTMMMIHNPWMCCAGESKDLRKMADALDKVAGAIGQTYVVRTQKDLAAITALMDAESWLTAQECLEQGFATEIADDFSEGSAAENLALARNFRALKLMKHVPDTLKDPSAALKNGVRCTCDCVACEEGDCFECSNGACDDKNCEGCPMQQSASASIDAPQGNTLVEEAQLAELRKRAVY